MKAPAILPAFSAGLLVCHRKNIEKSCPDPANFSVPFLYLRKDKSLSYTAKLKFFPSECTATQISKIFDFFSKKHLPNSFSYDNILLVAEQKSRQTKQKLRLRGQAVKTSPFHGGNTGSIPVGVIEYKIFVMYADVAQLAEQLICNQQVIGSSPIIGSLDL